MSATIAYYGGIVTDGLVLYLDAAKKDSYPGTGTVWNSVARGGLITGSLVNGPTFSSDNGGSIVFDGVDDYAIINDNPMLRGFTGLTISAWVNKRSKDIKIVSKWVLPGGGLAANYILRETSGQLQFYITTSSQIGGNIGINPSSGWKMYIATWDGSVMRAYLNGILSNTTYNQTGIIANVGSNLIIGAEYDTLLPCDANISTIQIHNRALSATEVLQNYNAQKSRFGLT